MAHIADEQARLTEEQRAIVSARVAVRLIALWNGCHGGRVMAMGRRKRARQNELIVAPDLVEFFRHNIAWPDFRRTAGFVLVIVGFGVFQFEFARYAAIAESAISKLYEAAHYPESSTA